MDWRLFLTTFFAIFVAELGDKTQLATFCFASDAKSRLTVFLAASAALVSTSAIAVLCADVVRRFVSPDLIRWLAGGFFVAIGIWMIIKK
ncbi:MAG: TMEM165/GDT1 family protein [Syntrophobacterales bacterium]|nr:TMEM165/GDT1 family protein [Syntrophobacterales bacterium]